MLVTSQQPATFSVPAYLPSCLTHRAAGTRNFFALHLPAEKPAGERGRPGEEEGNTAERGEPTRPLDFINRRLLFSLPGDAAASPGSARGALRTHLPAGRGIFRCLHGPIRTALPPPQKQSRSFLIKSQKPQEQPPTTTPRERRRPPARGSLPAPVVAPLASGKSRCGAKGPRPGRAVGSSAPTWDCPRRSGAEG